MRRSAPLLLACLLALTTAVALLGAGAMVAVPTGETAPFATSRDDAAANVALVRRFYETVNTIAATEDPAHLIELVAADFADRAAQPGHAPTRADLVRQILALRATFPALWIVVEDVSAHGEWVLARVRVEGTTDGVFLGAPFSGEPAAWAGLDVYRIAHGRIAERWAAGDWPVLPQLLSEAPLAKPPHQAVLRVARFGFAPGASLSEAGSLGPLLVVPETGTLTVEVAEPAVLTRGGVGEVSVPPGTAVSPGAEVVLRPGDGLLLPPGARNVFRNAEQTPVEVLALTLLPWSAGAPGGDLYRWPETSTPDVTARVLVEGVATDLPTGPATIALGKVTLAVQAEFQADGEVGPRLAVVEAGTLQLATIAASPITLSAGQGTIIDPSSVPALRNGGDGPLVVLLVTITPDGPATGR